MKNDQIILPIKILLFSQLIGMISLWLINWVKSPMFIFICFSSGTGLIALSLFIWIGLVMKDIKKELFGK